jgi:hypothetical protein
MWDVATGQEVLTLRGAPQRHWDPAFNPRVIFSPDGRRLCGANWDESISIWDAPILADAEALLRYQGARREAAEARAPFWHLQEAEHCLEHKNRSATCLHLKLLGKAALPGPLQSRKEHLVKQLGEFSDP